MAGVRGKIVVVVVDVGAVAVTLRLLKLLRTLISSRGGKKMSAKGNLAAEPRAIIPLGGPAMSLRLKKKPFLNSKPCGNYYRVPCIS